MSAEARLLGTSGAMTGCRLHLPAGNSPPLSKPTPWTFLILGCILYNAYSRLSTSVDSQPQTENTIFDPQLVESNDAKPKETEGQLYIYWILKKSTYKCH